MTLHHSDCLDVMAGMEPESVDAVVTDPPYGLEFMGKEWDKLDRDGAASFVQTEKVAKQMVRTDTNYVGKDFPKASPYANKPRWSVVRPEGWVRMQQWHQQWAEAAYRVAKPSAYLLAFGGTRTVHRMTTAIEDAGWIIRDMLVWAYASGFPKSKASLKPAWEPIVMARKPGPLRMLAIDECRIGTTKDVPASVSRIGSAFDGGNRGDGTSGFDPNLGRWPSNLVLTDPIFDGGIEGVVGGGEAGGGFGVRGGSRASEYGFGEGGIVGSGDSGTYSRFFVLPKADRADREPVLGGLASRVVSVWGGDEDDLTPGKKSTVARANHHPTVKPVDLMRHLVRLVTPTGGTVLDPFAGSGSTLIAAEMEGFDWIGIEKEREYVAIAEARLNGTQRGLGLPA